MLNDLGKEIHSWAIKQGFYDRQRNFGETMTLIHSEISEAFEEYRDGRLPNMTHYDGNKPEGIPSELADVIIRVLDTMTYYGIDIDAIVREKMNYNKTRPHMNGGKVI